MEERKQDQEQNQTEEKWTVAEIEGSNYSWWYVCGECHSQIDWHAPVCKHCKWRINWNG